MASIQAGLQTEELEQLMQLSYSIESVIDLSTDGASPTDSDAAPNLNTSDVPSQWPQGWQLPPNAKCWRDAVFANVFSAKAVIAWHKQDDRYALLFTESSKRAGGLESLLSHLVPAGAWQLDDAIGAVLPSYISQLCRYIGTSRNRYLPEFSCGRFISDHAHLHLGYRLCFESFNWVNTASLGELDDSTQFGDIWSVSHAQTLQNGIAQLIPNGADLYIAGHGVGGALAALAALWLESGNIDRTFNIKVYSYGSPKVGNDYLASGFDALFTTKQMAYRVYSSLDTVPQTPMTLQLAQDDLIDNDIVTGLNDSSAIAGHITELWRQNCPESSRNFCHVGAPYVLDAEVLKPDVANEEEISVNADADEMLSEQPNIPSQTGYWEQHSPSSYQRLIRQQILERKIRPFQRAG